MCLSSTGHHKKAIKKSSSCKYPAKIFVPVVVDDELRGRISDSGLSSNWIHPPNLHQISSLNHSIGSVTLTSNPDSWTCDLANDGRYKIKEVPLQVACFSWRSRKDKISTAKALIHRGMTGIELSCGFCGSIEEDTNHLLCTFPAAKILFDWVFTWCEIQASNLPTVEEVLNFADTWGNQALGPHCTTLHPPLGETAQKRGDGSLLYVTVRFGVLIWRARNDRLFSNKRTYPTKMADLIQSTVFFWLKFRTNIGNLIWTDWITNPFICL
ncbi:hypothetical protein LXL04_033601 [Taraxacum kok-saghyz]